MRICRLLLATLLCGVSSLVARAAFLAEAWLGPAGAAAAPLRQVWLVPREGSVGEAPPILPTPPGRSSPTLPKAAGAVEQTARAPAAEAGPALEAVKRDAIQALAERGGIEVWGLLRETLRDPDPAVRMAVLESVGPLASGPQLLQEALADADTDVRAIATFWLEQTASIPR